METNPIKFICKPNFLNTTFIHSGMKIVDVHCHLDLYGGEYDAQPFDIDKFLQEQAKAGVKVIISNGTDPVSNRKVLAMANKYPLVKAALGFYPSHLFDDNASHFEDELQFIRSNAKNIIAIGEIGLDNHHVKDSLLKQKVALTKLVNLAKELDKPILVHSRKAELETIELLETLGHKKVVMHCFSGRKHLVKRIIENGWYFSLPCNIIRAEHFQIIANLSPLSKLLTETDGPLLSPYKENPRNEPKFIFETINKVAEIKKMDPEEISNQFFMNYQKLFL